MNIRIINLHDVRTYLMHIFTIPSFIHISCAVAASLIAGIFLQSILCSFYLLFFICIILLLFLYYKESNNLFLYSIIIACLTGAALYQNRISQQEIWYFYSSQQPITLLVTITNIDFRNENLIRYVYEGCITALHSNNASYKCNKKFIIYSKKKLCAHIGDTLVLHNIIIKKPKKELSLYFLKENIGGTIFAPKKIETIRSHKKNIQTLIHLARVSLFNRLRKKCSSYAFTLYSLIFLGKKPLQTEDFISIKEHCKQLGISHCLARSGLHAVLVSSLWDFLLIPIPLPFFIKIIISLLLFLIYTLLTWSTISFVRSLLMFFLYKICLSLYRHAHRIHILSICTILVIITNPFYVFFLDFQLSFGITFLLIWINEVRRSQEPRSLSYS